MKIINQLMFVFILLALLPFPAFAWNFMGHRIVGEIAYQHLNPHTKESVDELIDYMSNAYPYSSSFQTANGWADYIKQDDIHIFDNWHFYDKPYTSDNTPVPQMVNSPNLIWALNQSISILKSPKSNQYEKALFLRFLIHFVGDAHQPLHCINRYTKNYPNGDQGGNLFLLASNSQDTTINLHASWDNGVGLFDKKCGFLRSKSNLKKAKCFAEKFQQDYPENYFGEKINNLNPEDWIDEGYQLAINTVYNTPENSSLSNNYLQVNQSIAEQQTTLAGYRLARLLNSIFS